MSESVKPQVTNPYGICHELIRTYGPASTVLVDDAVVVRMISIAELLPLPWSRA